MFEHLLQFTVLWREGPFPLALVILLVSWKFFLPFFFGCVWYVNAFELPFFSMAFVSLWGDFEKSEPCVVVVGARKS
jgi:hypothetical protein